MKRRDFLKSAGAAVTMLVAARVSSGGQKTMPRKPNLLFVFADQLRYQSLGYAGDSKAKTPNIDRLASQGVNFKNTVSVTPVCAPFRASLLTGKYTTSTGMAINEMRINPNQRCFGHVLTENGYASGYIGKWHLWANEAGNHGSAKNGFVPPGKNRLGFDGYWAAHNFNHDYNHGYYFEDTFEKKMIKGYEPDVQTDMAINFINKATGSDKPFSLFLSIGTPHDPLIAGNVPEEYVKRFDGVKFELPASWQDMPDSYMDREGNPKRWLSFWKGAITEQMRYYYAMISNLDDNIGRLMAALEKAGVADNTIVVFTSDHGEMFGAHGRVYKLIFYDEAARIPCLVRWPGKIPAGQVSDACVNTPDMMPTLLGLMGLPIPGEVEGMDLSHLAQGRPGPEPEAAYMQGIGHTYLWENGFEWRAMRDKQFTFAVYRRDGKELLFDNVNDPAQLHDLIDDPKHAATVARCRKALKARMNSLHDTFET
ncbi:MAG: sulfatase [bacterium]